MLENLTTKDNRKDPREETYPGQKCSGLSVSAPAREFNTYKQPISLRGNMKYYLGVLSLELHHSDTLFKVFMPQFLGGKIRTMIELNNLMYMRY